MCAVLVINHLRILAGRTGHALKDPQVLAIKFDCIYHSNGYQ